jgi:hypothetical protein
MSDDTFSVASWPFLPARRMPLDLDADIFLLLTSAARAEMASRGRSEIMLDLVIREPSKVAVYWSTEPLIRLSGTDRAFRARHRRYAIHEPLLGLVA